MASRPSPAQRSASRWDTAAKRITATLPGPVGEAGVTLAAFGPDGTLAVGYDNGDIRLWDTATEKTTRI
ncbi:MAG TPA: hypothetical protein VGD91_27050, partial [Trebonia sp.]